MRESVSEVDLITMLACDDAAVVVDVIRRIFESMELLDRIELAHGKWAFASFPASMMAHSLLSTWAQANQSLIDVNYWDDPVYVDEQRNLLRRLETRREQFPKAAPIRFVHVAWGLVRLGNHFLLHKREDKVRGGVKEYVLPGGRLNTSDLPVDKQSNPAILRELNVPDSILACDYLGNTLRREIYEELGLEGDDYSFSEVRKLNTFCKVEGAGNKHALTSYDIQIYHICLAGKGLPKLLEKIVDDSENLLWFSCDELVNGKRAGGEQAFIDALKHDFKDGLSAWLKEIPDSSNLPYLYVKDTDAIDLPAAVGLPLLRGRTGKEQSVQFDLTQFEWELLMLLGWCARDFEVTPIAGRVKLLGGGWVRLLDKNDLNVAKQLAENLSRTKFPLLEFVGNGLRLSINPEHLYFSEKLFTYHYVEVPRNGGILHLQSSAVNTSLGQLKGVKAKFNLPPNVANLIEAIEQNSPQTFLGKVADIDKQIRESVSAKLRVTGLRLMIRKSGGIHSIGIRKSLEAEGT